MLESLAKFLRASLRLGEASSVRFSDELEFASQYLQVEKVRWGDRLEVHTEIEPETEDALVPTFLLQPLLENAIRHGIATSEAGGRILVRAQRVDDQLNVRIENDGAGLPSNWDEHATDRVGLENTRRRLQLLYGNRHRLELNEIADGRVRLDLAIPFTTERTDPNDDRPSVGVPSGSET
jgi:LytS/YehU family sensor histidine kinase